MATTTSTKWADYSTPNPEFAAFLAASPTPPASLSAAKSLPIPQLRLLSAANATLVPGVNVPASLAGVEKSSIEIPVSGGVINALVWRPSNASEDAPGVVVAFHGGGWCFGRPEAEEVNCVNAVQRYGVVAVSVGYRLAPEHPFPGPVEDAWEAVKWIAANAQHTLGADLTKGFIVHGESAGGNLATVVALRARDEGLSPALTGVSASIPAVLSAGVVPEALRAEYLSYEQNRDAPGLDVGGIEYVLENYKPDTASPLFNPYLWPSGHKGLPPVFVQACGLDPMRDEALLFERMLREECGVRTRLEVHPGLPHAYWAFFPQLEEAKVAVRKTAEGLGWLLGREE